MVSEWLIKGKPSALGICSGIVAGLVAITPAAGYVGPIGAFFTCAFAGMICFFAVTKIKAWLGYDDALDTFGVHCVGGILGSLGTGLFVNPLLGGTGVYDYVANKVGDFDALAQMISQFWDIGITFVWSGLVAFVIMLILKHTIGIRANEQEEEEGLDVVDHGERAYNF
jgi:Amt family ammonium transporter